MLQLLVGIPLRLLQRQQHAGDDAGRSGGGGRHDAAHGGVGRHGVGGCAGYGLAEHVDGRIAHLRHALRLSAQKPAHGCGRCIERQERGVFHDVQRVSEIRARAVGMPACLLHGGLAA